MRNRILPSFVIVLTALIVTTMNLPAQPIAPKLVVPKCAKPPVMDGNIEKAEWQCTAAITGFVLFGGGYKLDPRQVIAYITYDDTNLYLAFELPIYPKGAKLLANLSTRDVGRWHGDDIVEILLDPFAGKHRNEDSYFQFMGNSKGAILFDQAETPGLGLYNRLEWNGRWTFRNKVLPDRWHAELSIPLKDLGINGIKDGAKWLAHFSRTWGAKVDWTTLSPTANALNVPGNGAELIFQSRAPAARLLSVGPLLNGRFGASGEVINGGDAERQITIEAWAASDDKQIAAKTLQVRLNPGEVHSFSFEETAELGEQNVFHLRITSTGVTEPLLEIGVPFLKTLVYPVFPDAVPIKFAFDARYLPSSQKLWIDRLDVSNFPDKKSVKEVRLELLREGESLLEKPIPLSGDGVKDLGIPVPNLVQQEGDYTITVSLLDAAGKTVASDSKSFWWKRMPFVQSPVPDFQGILPPFTPLTLEGKQVSVVGRTYVLNDLALFDQISAEQLEPTVGKPLDSLLQGPLSLSLKSDGRTITASPVSQLKVKASSNQYTVVEGQGKLDDIQLNITNRIEYDGLAWIEIELNPTKPVRVSSLSFDIPVRESQATLLHEVTDAIRRTYAGLTPTGTGTVWDSKRLLNTDGTLGNFKPLYWLGNEDRGLCWTGESDQGWYLDDGKPAIEVVRKPGEVVLRLNLINRGLLLSKPRTISFGLQATPVKPMPKGWRGWVAPYGPAEFKNLKYFNFSPVGNQNFFAAVAYAPYPRDYAVAKEKMDESRARGSVPFLYQVLRGAITDIPEVKAYLGEWGKVAYYGAKSFDEFRSWVLTQYLKRAGLHAYYEDNAYLSPVKDPAQGYGYVREDGQYQGRFPVRRMREYLRRQAAVYHTLGMPNYLAVHKSTTMMPPCYSFVTFAIDGEQRFMSSPDTDYIDQFPLDYFRTHIMGRQFGFVPIFLSEIHLGAGKKEAIKKGTRSEFALLWLHEIISWPAYDLDQATLDNSIRAIGEFDLGAPDVVFHPYWEKDKVATTDSKDVVVTLWGHPSKALAVVANLGDDKRTQVTFDFSRLKLKPQSAADFESKEKLPLQDGVLELSIPRHDYRLIWIE